MSPQITGLVLAVLTACGHSRRHPPHRRGRPRSWCRPWRSSTFGGGLVILIRFAAEIPTALGLVFDGAFTGTAATGGFAGSTVMMALRYGVARGLFSNEAGLGSAPIVHAAAQTDHPVRQGLYGIFEVFVDTILVCTTTGLVMLVTGVWTQGATGAALAGAAFSTGLPGTWGNFVVTMSLVLFAFSTVIGWSYYGETGIVYLFGAKAARALPAPVAGVHLPRLGGFAAPGVGHRRHAQRPDGAAQPAVRADVGGTASPVAGGFLRTTSVRRRQLVTGSARLFTRAPGLPASHPPYSRAICCSTKASRIPTYVPRT